MDVNNPELSLEQQFNLRSFETQVNQMSREQAQQFLIRLYAQMMYKETLYKQFLKSEWSANTPDYLKKDSNESK